MNSALPLAAACWLSAAAISVWQCTWDDSYIVFRYAQNFAEGLGMVFNPGQRVEGYTSFLWVFALGGASRLGWHPVLASKVLGVLLNVAALLACYILCRRLASDRVPMYGLALVLTASNTYFIVNTTSGLETPLFTALLCWGLVAFLESEHAADEKKQHRWQAGASILFALLVMTRPDGLLTYFLLWLYTAGRFPSRPSRWAWFALPFLLIYAPYFLFRWHYYSFPFPNTFYAKGGGSFSLFRTGATQTFKFLTLQTGGGLGAVAAGLSLFLFPAADATVLGLAVLSRIVFELWSGGITAGEYRFLVPALPLIWILTERLLTRAGAYGMRLQLRYFVPSVCAVVAAMQVGAFIHFRKHHVEPVRIGMERAHIAVGKWLASHSAPDAKVLVGDVGAIGYWSGREILDMDGLVDSHISHLRGDFGEKQDTGHFLGQDPQFIILRASACNPDASHVSFAPDKGIYLHPQFQALYGELGCWEFWPGYNLVVYERGRKTA